MAGIRLEHCGGGSHLPPPIGLTWLQCAHKTSPTTYFGQFPNLQLILGPAAKCVKIVTLNWHLKVWHEMQSEPETFGKHLPHFTYFSCWPCAINLVLEFFINNLFGRAVESLMQMLEGSSQVSHGLTWTWVSFPAITHIYLDIWKYFANEAAVAAIEVCRCQLLGLKAQINRLL